jgi:TolB-like protein/Tfp pilus assembly protein PilF
MHNMTIWTGEIMELEKLYNTFKGQFPDLDKELEQLIRTQDANVVMLYARRYLEVIITELCENELKRPRKTEPLKGIIDKLNSEAKVPPHIITSMQSLNSFSAYGTHPKDFDPEQVKPVLNNLTTIIKWYLKYKDTQIISKKTPTEEEKEKFKGKNHDFSTKYISVKKSRIILLLSGLLSVIIIIALAVFYFTGAGKPTKDLKSLEKSIAVLPFRNLSNDSTQVFFCDGFMEELLGNLQKVKSFNVKSRTSSDQYRDTKKSIITIGNELNVNYLIEGNVGHEGNNLKIWVQLIDSKTDKQIWSNEYLREMTIKQIFSLQSEIAQTVVNELKTKLSPEEIKKIESRPTENLDAYNLYLQGRYFWNKRTEDGFKKSIDYFEKSIAKDPNYALAYSGLADVYYSLTIYEYLPRRDGYFRAKELALKAIDIDKNLAEAHATLGSLLIFDEWKWEEARKELLLAIELNPNYATAHFYYSNLLDILGQNQEARVQINLAMELDPRSSIMRTISGLYYYRVGKYQESLNESLLAQNLNPDLFGTYFLSFMNYVKQGQDFKAVEALVQAMLTDTLYKKIVRDVYKNSGMNGIFNWLINANLKQISNPFYSALWYTKLDKKEEVLKSLEKGFKERTYDIPRINNMIDFDYLRSEPRFKVLIKKMGLSEYEKKE